MSWLRKKAVADEDRGFCPHCEDVEGEFRGEVSDGRNIFLKFVCWDCGHEFTKYKGPKAQPLPQLQTAPR